MGPKKEKRKKRREDMHLLGKRLGSSKKDFLRVVNSKGMICLKAKGPLEEPLVDVWLQLDSTHQYERKVGGSYLWGAKSFVQRQA